VLRIKLAALAISLLIISAASADIIVFIDYSQDTNNFFNTQAKKDALQAAANRWAGIIQSSLLAVGPSGTGSGTAAGWRIGFSHPGTGADFQISTAAGPGTDPLIGGGAANVYGFGGLAANTWYLYAGGRALMGPAGVGGTGTGLNFTSTFNDLNGPMHRGVISNTPANTVQDLPVWGGSIAFDTATSWHYDPSTPAPTGTVDFYSIALHEIGHALGLNVGWNQWTSFVSGSVFNGPSAVSAYNTDNGTSITSLNMVSAANLHWQDGTYDSRIFPLGNPNYVGTVGAGVLQDLLMEPTANFTGTLRRFEATNVEVGALRDLGWTTLAVPELSTTLYLAAALASIVMIYSFRARKPAQGADAPKPAGDADEALSPDAPEAASIPALSLETAAA
jgi:hypothetical protein